MRGAVIGAVVGGGLTFAIVFVVVMALSPADQNRVPSSIFAAVWLAGNGATLGAVFGAARDCMVHLRRALPVRHGPEDDYRDQASADHDAMPALLPILRLSGLIVLITAGLALLLLIGKNW
ncbi:MAG TPA: hypothetical protein VKD71_05875 [Gemmataceae bacterium]|nr:hypothetical protein [Gemmataceae bacterium]